MARTKAVQPVEQPQTIIKIKIKKARQCHRCPGLPEHAPSSGPCQQSKAYKKAAQDMASQAGLPALDSCSTPVAFRGAAGLGSGPGVEPSVQTTNAASANSVPVDAAPAANLASSFDIGPAPTSDWQGEAESFGNSVQEFSSTPPTRSDGALRAEANEMERSSSPLAPMRRVSPATREVSDKDSDSDREPVGQTGGQARSAAALAAKKKERALERDLN